MMVIRVLFFWFSVAAVFLASAEISARMDDFLRFGSAITDNPDHENSLILRDEYGIRGRPNGLFKKWHLNEFGFRTPPMSREPDPACVRIMLLGSSETFGLYESPGKEYSAQMAQLVRPFGCYEIINGAIVGMTVRSMIPYWKNWVSQFKANTVIIYPSAWFYLGDELPANESGGPKPIFEGVPEKSGFKSRFMSRMWDSVHAPEAFKRWKAEQQLRTKIRGKEDDWFVQIPPKERIELFNTDLSILVNLIKKNGASPIILTHASGVSRPPSQEDLYGLRLQRLSTPRYSETCLIEFENKINSSIIEFGLKNKVKVIDIAAKMNGHREWFADMVHFTDEGAAMMAGLISREFQIKHSTTSYSSRNMALN